MFSSVSLVLGAASAQPRSSDNLADFLDDMRTPALALSTLLGSSVPDLPDWVAHTL